ncbi:MAG: hydroxyacid dehydrogenase [Chloroflexota bacterium]
MYHVLIPDNIDKQAIELLERHPAFSVNAPGKMTRKEALAAAAAAHALVIRSSTIVDDEFIESAPNLRAIARAGVGIDNVDLAAATARGIIVMNTPDGNTISTAEYAFGMMLALARNVPQGHQSLCEGKWDRKAYMGTELRGKTLGIVGFGRVGRAVARRARAFDMTVIAVDPSLQPGDDAKHEVEGVDLDTLFKRSDFISLHAVINDETRGLICAENIIKMKTGVYIINTARGGLINDQDLAVALQHGHVAGAALDVYHQEPPPPDNPLLGLSNVIHTPHLAASTNDAQIQVGIDAAQQIIDGLTATDFRNVCNTEVLHRV